jgi:hypothetical protein
LPKARLLGVIEAAVSDEPVDNIRLPQRNETIPLFRRGRLAMRLIHATIAYATTTIARSLSDKLEARQ